MSQKDPNTLEVSVTDTVGVAELGPGGPTKGAPETPELTNEELAVKIRERQVELVKYYVEPHNKPSRMATDADVERIQKDATIMHEMCIAGRADYVQGHALAHTQINDTDPIRFFVWIEDDGRARVFINPVIETASGEMIAGEEGCMSYPSDLKKVVFRYKHVKLRFQTLGLKVDKATGEQTSEVFISEPGTVNIYGHNARIVQHEVSHLNGHNIYDNDFSVFHCMGTGQPESGVV